MKRPKILPREPLTKKAEQAIWRYVWLRTAKSGPIGWLMFKATLAGERMRRSDLYALLEAKGFRWFPRHGIWDKPLTKGGGQ